MTRLLDYSHTELDVFQLWIEEIWLIETFFNQHIEKNKNQDQLALF